MIESHWRADVLATIFGVILVAVGLLGFVPNPVVYDSGFFQVNAAHNFAHLISGGLLMLSPFFGAPVLMIRALAVAYAAIAILGFAAPNAVQLGGLLAVNTADNWLHAAIAAVLLAIGFTTPMERSFTLAHM
ncbi:MAG: DUF4383 domain-containing protein [Methylocystis sp.]|uniref:DUF4383 domain-containing protein n=1 Tax=Methylocystis sp. TaxID=1911079 RepID=UPI003D0E23D3